MPLQRKTDSAALRSSMVLYYRQVSNLGICGGELDQRWADWEFEMGRCRWNCSQVEARWCCAIFFFFFNFGAKQAFRMVCARAGELLNFDNLSTSNAIKHCLRQFRLLVPRPFFIAQASAENLVVLRSFLQLRISYHNHVVQSLWR